MKLDDIRKKIDLIDEKILQNLSERMILASEVKKLKKHLNLPIEDKKREAEVIENIKNKGKKLGLAISLIGKIFDLLIEESKRIQEKL